MSRLKELRNYVNEELNKIDDIDERTAAFVHLYGVSLAATMIAKKRGLNPEILSMAAMLHDLYAYKTGSYEEHAHKGADLARKVLEKLQLTEKVETDLICSAIYHHDDKLILDSPMDEALKDADVISHCLHDTAKPIKEKEQARFEKICNEFGCVNSGEAMGIDKISQIKEKCDKATKGPWISFVEGRDFTSGCSFIKTSDQDIELTGATTNDQDFIASCRQDIPLLINEIERLRKLLNDNGIDCS